MAAPCPRPARSPGSEPDRAREEVSEAFLDLAAVTSYPGRVPGLAVLAGLMSVLAAACPTDPVDALFSSYDGQHPGASVVVVKDGAVIFERAYGMANVGTGERATPQTNYRLASVTKPFTAMAVSILAERGALAVDDPVAKYLPELAQKAPTVTLRHLLTHTSGLPEYEKLLPKDDPKQIVDRDVLGLLAKRGLAIVPGARYRYNNTGYALLALVIERVSKQSYAEFLRRNIFQPLGMANTQVYDANAKIAARAYGYSVATDQAAPADQNRTSAVLGDGGIYSSAHELARWIDALDRNRLLAPKRLAEATSALVTTDEPRIAYGFGWRISEDRGEKVVYHTGTTSGFKNALVWVPSKKLAAIVLTNRRQGEPLKLAMFVLDQFWNQ
jgi:CubicO group peptidase (beta-lactamase class C family)